MWSSKYHDKGVGEWDLSGHQANVKEFHTTKEMYANKKLLMQHALISELGEPRRLQQLVVDRPFQSVSLKM